MGARTGAEYLQRLRSVPREVWLDGRRVDDVTEEPAFRESILRLAELYDLQFSPEHAEHCLYESPTTGDLVATAFMVPRSHADLVKRRRAFAAFAQHTFGLMGRSQDFLNTTVMAFAEASEVFARGGERYGRNIVDYCEYIRENDLFLTHALISPQIDRSRSSGEQREKLLHLGVAEETPEGIVVHGARMLATLAPMADEILIYNLPGMREGDEDHAVAFAVPLESPGLRIICRQQYERGDSRRFDHPLAHTFEESDAIVVFDHVHVPWERVFVYRNVPLANAMYGETNLRQHTAHQTNVRGLVKCQLVAGVAMALAKAVKIDGFLHVQQRLGEMVGQVEMIKSGIIRSEYEFETAPGGSVRCRFEPLQTLRIYLAAVYPQMVESLQTLGAGGLMIVPSDADFTGGVADDVHRYFQGAEGLAAVDRARIFRIAADLTMTAFGSRLVQYERYYAGDPVRLVAGHYLAYDKSEVEALVKRACDLAGDPTGVPAGV
jgi:anthranilate 3-monooxygenase (FAD)/4-hydroxyphenylacetate 3-monooxygenase